MTDETASILRLQPTLFQIAWSQPGVEENALDTIVLSSNNVGRQTNPTRTPRRASHRSSGTTDHEVCRFCLELEQLDADRDALFALSPPPVPGNPAQSKQFFTKLNAITARYLALEQRLREGRSDIRQADPEAAEFVQSDGAATTAA